MPIMINAARRLIGMRAIARTTTKPSTLGQNGPSRSTCANGMAKKTSTKHAAPTYVSSRIPSAWARKLRTRFWMELALAGEPSSRESIARPNITGSQSGARMVLTKGLTRLSSNINAFAWPSVDASHVVLAIEGLSGSPGA
jgi:hypothetical protein